MKNLLLLTSILVFTHSITSQECFFLPTETRYWDAAKAYNGYTLFGSGGTTYLIDMEGHIMHSWKIGTNPRFTENGTLLDAAGGDPSRANTWKELDWNGNVVWEYTEARKGYWPHHDFEKIYNPKLGDSSFIYIANKDLTLQQCLDAGCDSADSKGYATAQMDVIVEVDRTGKVIWEWSFFDHVVQDIDASKPTYGSIKDNSGKINLNLPGNPVQKDWLHCNSLDYNQDLDLIVINSVQGEFYVIDHGNTFVKDNTSQSIKLAASSAGDFLYRFGDPARYNQGDPPSILENWTKATSGHKQIGGAHNIQWIRPGLPGQGNFLIFNNAQNLFELTPQSYILEINPYLNATGLNTGKYVNPPSAGYNIVNSPDRNLMKEKKNISKQVVWAYSSKNNVNFYSTIGSSAQRLPNGNTFVCSMNDGHFFEIAPNDTSIVWEYVNPSSRNGIRKIKVDKYPTDNAAFRAYRYTSDHPALKGQTLQAGKTITGFDPDYLEPKDLNIISSTDHFSESNKNNLGTNYPNPFSYQTSIPVDIREAKRIELIIYNLSGDLIKVIANKKYPEGKYELSWDGKDQSGNSVNPGIYYYVLRIDHQIESKKMIYIK